MGNLVNNVTRSLCKVKKGVSDKSDVITLIFGITCGVAAVGTAIYKSRKAVQIIDEHKKSMEQIRKQVEVVETENGDDKVNDKEIRKQVAKVYGKTAWQLFRCYAVTAGLTVASGGFNIWSHSIVKGRYLGALATAVAATSDLAHYRENVVKELGEEMDEHFMYDTEEIEVEETETDAKGKEKKVKKKVKVAKRGDQFSKALMASKRMAEKTGGAAYLNARAALIAVNEKLVSNGYMTWNDTLSKYFGYQITNNFAAGVIDDPLKSDEERFIQIKGFGTIRMSSEGYIFLDSNTESEELKAFRRGRTQDYIMRFENIQLSIAEDISRFIPSVEVMDLPEYEEEDIEVLEDLGK